MNELQTRETMLGHLESVANRAREVRPAVTNWIARCAVTFPDYGVMDEAMIKGRVAEFSEALAEVGATPTEAEEAFRTWRGTGKKFPVPADIIEIIKAGRPEPTRRDDFFRVDPNRKVDLATSEQWSELLDNLKGFAR